MLSIEPDYIIRTTDVDHVRRCGISCNRSMTMISISADTQACTARAASVSSLRRAGCWQMPDHLVEPKAITEQNYFFRMSKYQDG